MPRGEAVPVRNGLRITHSVQLELRVGKSESGTLMLGLYGGDCPELTQQLLDFFGKGVAAFSGNLEDGYGVSSAPVSLANGGALNTLYPGERLEFGVASQGAAYARSKGSSKPPADFLPQPRPTTHLNALRAEISPRKHDAAGLLSLPRDGLGYGGTGFESDDEAFASAFQITAKPLPNADAKERRKVVGQILDDNSMAFLARLSSLPTQKGLKGIVPNLNYGPPLLKVPVKRVTLIHIHYTST